MGILTWIALFLGVAAVWSTRTLRSEQTKLQTQLDALKRQLAELRWSLTDHMAAQKPTEHTKSPKDVEKPGRNKDVEPVSSQANDSALEHKEEPQIPAWLTSQSKKKKETDKAPESHTPAHAAPIPPQDKNSVEAQSNSEPAAAPYTPKRSHEKVKLGNVLPENTNKPAIRPQPKKRSFEERLGAGVYVWAGGIALMLAGAFLVKYSFDNDLLSVGQRLGIAGGFGAALVLASLWVHSRADKVAASLCGAGVAVMYAAVLSGTAHFGVITPWIGFALMILVTATAVGMSLRHGPFVALLGLIGGFVTPALINGVESAWGPTFTYLLLLEIGLAVVTRKRQWFGLSALTLALSILSAVVYALFAWDTDSRGWLILFVMGTAVVFVLNAARYTPDETRPRSAFRVIWLGVGALGSSALLLSMLVAVSGFSTMELVSLGVLGAGAVVLARLDRRYVALAYLADVLCGMMLLAWPLAYEFSDAVIDPTRYLWVASGYGAVFTLGGFLCLRRLTRPVAFAWMSAGSALGYVILAHVGGGNFLEAPLRWWMIYAGVAGLLMLAAGAVWRTREKHDGWLVDAYALTAAALGTFAVWFGLDHPWVPVAWSGLALAVCVLDRRLGRHRLLYATGWLTALSVLMLIVPGPTGYVMPMRLVANSMLLHYGLPGLCFAGIAWFYRSHRWPWVGDTSQALALVAGVTAVSLQVRLGFHPEVLWDSHAGLYEWATHAALWLSVCWLVLKWFNSDSLKGLNWAATGIGALGLIASVLYLLLHTNPIFMQTDLGDLVVLNGLLYAYGLPCVLAAMVACVMPKAAGPFKQAAGVVSFALLFTLVVLEVRHGFVGTNMLWSSSPRIGLTEWTTYGVALTVLSLLLTWAGRWRQTDSLALPAAVIGTAGIVAAVCGTLLIANPLIVGSDVGSMIGLNWLLYVYGLPCALAAALAYVTPAQYMTVKKTASGVSLLMLFAFVVFEVRHGFVGTGMVWSSSPAVVLNEWATYGVALMLVSLTMSWFGRWRSLEALAAPAGLMGAAGLVVAVAGPIILNNPLYHPTDVGLIRVFNWLLYIYGLPCLLAAAMTYKSPQKLWPLKEISVGVSLLLLFALVSFQIRQGFVGTDLMEATHPISSAENYSYSLAWVLLALALLAGGLVTGSASLRYGSLAVMLVAVCKVALDTAQLRDLWRVLSLLGLGLSLIVLGYVYQRYVFRRPPKQDDDPDDNKANEHQIWSGE